MRSKNKIVFCHIPKCGGMSIVAGLAYTYYPWRLVRHGKAGFPAHLNSHAASVAADELGLERYQYRRGLLHYHLAAEDSPLISGHYPFCADAARRYPDWSFVTLMRDPYARWLSEYYWNRYKDHDYARTALGMEEYLETEQGQSNTRSYINFLTHAPAPSAPPSHDECKQALENLNSFKVLGVLEHLERFRDDMKKSFGRKPYFLKRNRTPASKENYKKPDTDSAFYKKLTSMLEPDMEVYNAVLRNLRIK